MIAGLKAFRAAATRVMSAPGTGASVHQAMFVVARPPGLGALARAC
jgi:hypothetical protein